MMLWLVLVFLYFMLLWCMFRLVLLWVLVLMFMLWMW